MQGFFGPLFANDKKKMVKPQSAKTIMSAEMPGKSKAGIFLLMLNFFFTLTLAIKKEAFFVLLSFYNTNIIVLDIPLEMFIFPYENI